MAYLGDTSQILVDTTDVFTTDQKFATLDDVVTWARDVGDANKVGIIITRSDKKNEIRGRNDKLILGCDKRVAPSTDGSGWKVRVIHGVHNHGLPDQYHGHPHKTRLTDDENKRVEDLTKRKVAPRHIVLDLKDQNSESVVDATLIYRKRHMMQIQERGSRTEPQHLLQWLDDAKYVIWNRRKDDGSDVLSDIFWAYPYSIKLLNLFPIVLVMDCTYKTNKYRQPLLEITGITSTNMTFAVGFAYMESEKTNNYHWTLGKLKELVTKQDIFPKVILTDKEFTLMNAIKDIFPHTTNMLCT
ncbi:protein FAR1-RELATED SEQUENCE 5-like [Trifolium pratense]|uniref:protein FAR1-RELATED SEQUENCE 5-like n=1 Tax=Trifolium pratense TaxID=57577 RepID=UPI001E695651|nr:protein FAR1-RELATED SEQUENCE 5-like [Trifolium pratense]